MATTFRTIRLYANLLFETVAPFCVTGKDEAQVLQQELIEWHSDVCRYCLARAGGPCLYPSKAEIEATTMVLVPQMHEVLAAPPTVVEASEPPKAGVPGLAWA
ncbi:hypothetical protein [Streptomyces sp. NBC_01716]|uniref:hypothetical protein n=1 Tax=Streptomyces sp. NBC_01716 TaxID=2975917 RepID=UPI002E31FCDE|nr:hypothetical protein [Streptomyces sp. NBC_01716]